MKPLWSLKKTTRLAGGRLYDSDMDYFTRKPSKLLAGTFKCLSFSSFAEFFNIGTAINSNKLLCVLDSFLETQVQQKILHFSCKQVAISSISRGSNGNAFNCISDEDVLIAYEIESEGKFELYDVGCGKLSSNKSATHTVFVRAGADCSDLLDTVSSSDHCIEHALFLKSRIGDEIVLQFAEAVADGCKHVRALAFLHSCITAQGAQRLSEGLQLHASLRVLDLSHNSCCSTGAESLAGLVLSCPTLKTLRLRDNRIGPRGATALAAALNPPFVLAAGECLEGGLEILDLSVNFIDDNGAAELAAALVHNRSLLELDVSCNTVTVVGAERLVDAIERNRTLRRMLVRAAAVGAEQEARLGALRRRVEEGQWAHW